MSDGEPWLEVTVGDRVIEALQAGRAGGLPLLYQNGTPFAAAMAPHVIGPATEHGLSFLTFSRPGYGRSTPQPGRSVADVVTDAAAVLEAVGASSFVTIGWSGGGPHALACAALMPDRCRAAAIIGGVAPYGAGIDWLAGMAPENVEEFGAALGGEAPLTEFLQAAVPTMATVSAEDLAASLGELVSAADRAALTAGLAEYLAGQIRHALSTGIAGWRDDDLAFVKDWAFVLDALSVPVAIWQGDQDRMVPFAHGQWLATAMRGARAHLLAGEGHISLLANHMDEIVGELAALARA